MELGDLLLLSGNDIHFEEANLIIHQPSVKEIAFIGEEAFYTGCEFLKFTKDMLDEKDKFDLTQYSNFDVLMSIMRENNSVVQKNKICATMVLGLLFPNYTIDIKDKIILKQDDLEFYIDNSNFDNFKAILNEIFCLQDKKQEYNPVGDLSSKIAEKLKKRHQKLAQVKKEKTKVAFLSRLVSILAVGAKKDMNALLGYTVYQLNDEFQRYQLKEAFDIHLKAQMAGAKDLKDVDDWTKDIHS